MDELKKTVAKAALAYLDDINDDIFIGIGTGSTVNYFIEQLATVKHRINGCVASSKTTEARLKSIGLPIIDLNTISNNLPIYIDGADEVNQRHEMLKGGGGALTREKIIATNAQQFICIVDESKVVNRLGTFPLAIEVIPMARSFVARELVKLGGDPVYRQGFVTDNGNIILDVHHLDITVVATLEDTIKVIPGVVDSGLFGKRLADIVLVASAKGVIVL